MKKVEEERERIGERRIMNIIPVDVRTASANGAQESHESEYSLADRFETRVGPVRIMTNYHNCAGERLGAGIIKFRADDKSLRTL